MPSITQVHTALDVIKTDESKVLGLTVASQYKVTPGLHIKKAGKLTIPLHTGSFTDIRIIEAQSPPELSFNATPGTTYLVIGLDIDAPFKSFDVLGPILHWIQPGLKGADTTGTLTSTDPFVANYIGPAPPPLSGPHRYVFLLYEQPADFDGKKYAPAEGQKLGNGKRMWFDLGAFEKKTKLGPVLAANYFVSN